MILVFCMSACRWSEATTALARQQLTGVLLAGGQATRMGGCDKGWLPLAGTPLVVHSLRRLQPQVATVVISANRHLEQYRILGSPVICDQDSLQFRGPLAGVFAALGVAATPYLLTAPCDAPRLPLDYAVRLWAAAQAVRAPAAVVSVAGQWQPVFALITVELRSDLAAWLASGQGGVGRWLRRHQPVVVEFSDSSGAWENLNTPEHLARLEAKWHLTAAPETG